MLWTRRNILVTDYTCLRAHLIDFYKPIVLFFCIWFHVWKILFEIVSQELWVTFSEFSCWLAFSKASLLFYPLSLSEMFCKLYCSIHVFKLPFCLAQIYWSSLNSISMSSWIQCRKRRSLLEGWLSFCATNLLSYTKSMMTL